MNKIFIYTISALVLVSGLMLSAVNKVDAQSLMDGRSTLSERIATRFNLNKDDVQKVFDEQRVEMQKVRMQEKEDRLSQAVSDGVITEEQKSTIVEKFNEKLQERQQNREEMQNWFEDQGIDHTKLFTYLGRGMGRRVR